MSVFPAHTDTACGPLPAAGGVSTPDLLILLSRLTQGVLTTASHEHRLTPGQARLLGTLAAGPKSMSELSNELGVERAAITGLVDRAEKAELVRREPVPGDRRATAVTLTEQGRALGTSVYRATKETLSELLSALTATETEQFARALTKLVTPEHGCTQPEPGTQPASKNHS